MPDNIVSASRIYIANSLKSDPISAVNIQVVNQMFGCVLLFYGDLLEVDTARDPGSSTGWFVLISPVRRERILTFNPGFLQ